MPIDAPELARKQRDALEAVDQRGEIAAAALEQIEELPLGGRAVEEQGDGVSLPVDAVTGEATREPPQGPCVQEVLRPTPPRRFNTSDDEHALHLGSHGAAPGGWANEQFSSAVPPADAWFPATRVRGSSDVPEARPLHTHCVAEVQRDVIVSGDPLFTFDADLRILSWNRAAEEMTSVPAEEAVGRYCWEVLSGHDDAGAIVCHAGCSWARLVREGWPVPSHDLVIRAGNGERRRIALSTIALRDGEAPRFLHLMHDAGEIGPEEESELPVEPLRPPTLTPRQRQVLELLGVGKPAKVISAELGLSETTVRNHIRAILLELDCHSQLAAVAKGRRLGLI